MYKLYLDDYRIPTDSYKTTNNSEWTIARSYNEFVRIIETKGLPHIVSFDHDLAEEHYPTRDTIGEKINYEVLTEKTGYHCAMWLIEYCLKNGRDIPQCCVHSANPVGRANISSLLNSFERIKATYEASETGSFSQ